MIKNYLSLIVSQIIGRLVSLAWVIYLARFIGVQDYGRYGAIMAVISIGAAFIDFGVHFIVVREGIKRPQELPRLVGAQVYIRMMMSVLVTIGIMLVASISKYSFGTQGLFFLACVHMLFHNLGMIGDTVFSVKLKQRLTALMNLVHTTGWALLGFFALKFWGTLTALFVVMVLNSLVYCLASTWIVTTQFVRPDFTFLMRTMVQLIKWAWPIGLTGIFGILFQRIDRVLLVWLKGTFEVGIYNAVSTLIMPIADFIWSLAIIILYPYMIHLYAQAEKFEAAFRNILVWLFLGMLFFAIPAIFFPQTIIYFIFGQKFAASSALLPTLALSLLPVPFHGFFGRVLMIQNKEKEYAYANCAAMVLNTGLNLLLIPKIGAQASCWGAVVTNLALFLFYSFFSGQSIVRFIRFNQVLLLTGASVAIGILAKLTEPINTLLPFLVFGILFIPVSLWIIGFKTQWNETRVLLSGAKS